MLLSSTALVGLGTVLDFLRSKQARCGVYPAERLIGKLLRCFSVRTAVYRQVRHSQILSQKSYQKVLGRL